MQNVTLESGKVPFLSPQECRTAGIAVVRHRTMIDGEEVWSEIGKPADAAQLLTFCRDDDALVAEMGFNDAKLRQNAAVRQPWAKAKAAQAKLEDAKLSAKRASLPVAKFAEWQAAVKAGTEREFLLAL